MEKILVIDDDPAVERILRRTFEADRFDVGCVQDGMRAMEALRIAKPQLIILDLYLPGKSGTDLCREIKQQSPSLPIIVLSAACDVVDKVLLFELGADDYVTKPFSPRELLARVRVAVRRQQHPLNNPDVFRFGDVEVNFSGLELRRDGRCVPMTAQEFKILRFFLKNEKRVVSRNELLDEVWGYQSFPTTRTVDTHMLRLRQKLEPDPGEPVYFQTVRGTGYRFVR
jgi:DNA-binding response OmpR family regulator